MKPLGIFVGIVVIGLAVIVGALHLTDHPASATPPAPTTPAVPKALTQAQFDRAGNAICVRYYHVDAPLSERHLKTVREVTTYVRVDSAAFDRQVASFRALVPPPNDAGMYRRLLRGLGREGRDLDAVRHDFETRQYRVGVLKVRQVTPALGRHLNRLARKLGLNICGLNGRQERARYG